MGKDNRYPGINPHLNSHLQHVEGWEGFHNLYLADMLRVLEPRLNPGYYCLHEASLQRDDKFFGSITIYRAYQPVTRIELISPYRIHEDIYTSRRKNCPENGICLVEIDYLHAGKPVLNVIPSYPDRHHQSQPYSIIVSNPRPNLTQGIVYVYGFGVLDTLPIIDIPLDGDNTVRLDFGQVYSRTFSGSYAFNTIFTDYTREPVNFDAYSDADKMLIRQHMGKINGSPQD